MLITRWNNYNPEREIVLKRKLEIALIVRRNAHYRPAAIAWQDVVCNPNRHAFMVKGIDHEAAGGDAAFVSPFLQPLNFTPGRSLLNIFTHGNLLCFAR